MAALTNTVHTYVHEDSAAAGNPAAKRQKKDTDDAAGQFGGLSNPPHDVRGIANAIFTALRTLVFLMKGDRHFWVGNTKKDYGELFYEKGDNLKGTPFQVHTVNRGHLTFCGVRYEPIDQARWILKHMLSKGWAPTCCFDTREDAIAAVERVKNKDYSDVQGDTPTVTGEKLIFLHDKLLEFTNHVASHPYTELVMVAVEIDGVTQATRDMNAVVETLYKETYEEAGAKKKEIQDKVQFFGWSDPFTSRKTGDISVTAIFVSDFENHKDMEGIWRAEDKVRRPVWKSSCLTEYGEEQWHISLDKWRCPHPWYKVIPGIEGNQEALANGAHEKAIQETRSGMFVSVDVALSKENFMDEKNKAVLRKILGK